MAFTFRGIGTIDYGKRDFRSDGSFVTTLWFVVLYFPLIPIRSKRIGATGEVKYYGMFPRRVFALHEKTKPNRTQVLSVYAWWTTEFVLFVTARVEDMWWIAVPGVLLLPLPWLLRRRATEQLKAENARKEMGFSPTLPE